MTRSTSNLQTASAAAAVPTSKPARPAKSASKSAPQRATKSTAKPRVSATASAAKQAPAKATKPALSPTAATLDSAKDAKAKKPKLVRDSFTIPKDEYAVIETLKQRATALGQPVKKSELLRAGLKVLALLSDSALRSAVQAVPSIKTGRPKAESPVGAPSAAPAPALARTGKPATKTAKPGRK